MASVFARVALALSAIGYPLTQLAIRSWGFSGALVAEAVSVALLVRDAGLIAIRTSGRLRRGPAILLWFETVAAAVATVSNLRLLVDANARERALEQGPDRLEVVRRSAVGALYGVHTIRFWIYLRPDRGLRAP